MKNKEIIKNFTSAAKKIKINIFGTRGIKEIQELAQEVKQKQ